jgi:predicted acylesterase/phospholipase RssA/CRP-like cAMP-binding protein
MSENKSFDLTQIELFRDLDGGILLFLESQLEWMQLKSGEALFNRGDDDDSLYIVSGGRLIAVMDGDVRRGSVLGEIAPGDIIGEMSALFGETRCVTILAQRDSELVRLPGEAVIKLFERSPQFLLKLSRIMFTRLRQSLRRSGPKGRVGSIALVILDETLSGEKIAERFRRALTKKGKVMLVTDVMLDQHGNAKRIPTELLSPEDLPLANWLSEQEDRNDFMLYLTPARSPDWRSFVIRQADRVLFVVGDKMSSELTDAERQIWDLVEQLPFSHTDLVVMHKDRAAPPRDTLAWFKDRSFVNHYHAVEDQDADYDRIVRCVLGVATGLVLGGGGARGFAHVGAIRALWEHGISIDHLAGTSMGAVIAAEVGMGMDYEQMMETNRKMFIESNPTSDFTIPLVSLVTGHKCNRSLREGFGDTLIEDLWLPVFFVTASLTSVQAVFIEKGSVWETVRASVSIPGIFPPVIQNGEMLVDGSIVTGLPVIEARRRFEGQIIAVEVSNSSKLKGGIRDSLEMSAKEYVLNRFRRENSVQWPSILDVLLAAGTFAKEQSLVHAKAGVDLLIQPQVHQFESLDWRSMEAIVTAGYEETARALEADDISFLSN